MARPRGVTRFQPLERDKDLLAEIHDRFNYASQKWTPIRNEAKTDMRYVKGDPWDPVEKSARIAANRPALATDELSQYSNQVINDLRANPRGAKFSPIGDGANDDTALFYQNKHREIEYRSHAQIAYTTAGQNAIERSYGYVRVATEFLSERSLNQRLVIQQVADPDSIYPDPDFVDPTGRDWQYLFEIEGIPRPEFLRRFPKAEIRDFSPEMVNYAQGWITKEQVRVANYWKVKKTPATLTVYQFPDGKVRGYFEDETEKIAEALNLQAKEVGTRDVERTSVCCYVTNGVEVLAIQEWAGKWIPFAACFGKMLWVDEGSGSQLNLLSMTRLARDPYMLLCYITSSEMELVGMTPKFPYFFEKGTLDKKNLERLQKSLHIPVAAIEVDLSGISSPNRTGNFPQRNPYEPAIQPLEILREAMRRAIQAAMGLSPLPSSAQRRNEKSGIALKQIEESGQRGSYHFVDHYDMLIERVAELNEDLIPKIYDYSDLTPLIEADDSPYSMAINGFQADAEDIEAMESLDGSHAVTISVGPAFESERQEASEFVDTFVTSKVMELLDPQQRLKTLAMAIRMKNLGPKGDQLADIIDPPQEGDQASPEQLQAAVQEGQQLLQQAQEQIALLTQEKEARLVEERAQTERTMLEQENKREIEQMKADLALLLQEKKDRAALELQLLKNAAEQSRQNDQQTHDAQMAAASAAEARRSADQAQLADMAGMGGEA